MQKITLEKIHHDIVEWRKSKKYKCEPIPQQIWESIRQIHKEYKKEEIIKTLGIKLSMYKKEVESSADIRDVEPNFFTIKHSNFPRPSEQSITVKRADGVTLSINNFDNEHLNSLMLLFKNIA
jgi:wyosine [tRNA(Phe)-imidazoG37] synthetase (radical SAM superfamily)